MKAILISARNRLVAHRTLRSPLRTFSSVFAEPRLVGRLPNGDVIWSDTDRIQRAAFSVGNGPQVVGVGLIVGKKDEFGDHANPRSDVDSIRGLVRFSELAPFEVDTTPRAGSPEIQEFVRELKSEPPTFVRVADVAGGRSGRCWVNVAIAVRMFGGHRVHGWAIWEREQLFLTAEFHAVWCTPDGELIDVTPKVDREKRILFSADPIRYPPHFNFLQRPGNRRYRLYRVVPDLSATTRRLSSSRLAYETRQAAKRGLSLKEHLASKIPPTELEGAIDRLFGVCAEIDTLVEVTARGMTSDHPDRVAALDAEKMRLHEAILRLARERLGSTEPVLKRLEA